MQELHSRYCTVKIDPGRGGAILSIISHAENDEWIYYNLQQRIQHSSAGLYDDVWCGGFEELFPNDAPGVVNGRMLKDHGELWQASWDMKEKKEHTVTMEMSCESVPAIISKTIFLETDLPRLAIKYKIENCSSQTYPYLFKLHPAMRIEAGDQILMPGGEIIPVDISFSKILGHEGPFLWPLVEGKLSEKIDISMIPPRQKILQEFIYVNRLPQGWCGLRRNRTKEEFVITYPMDVFPYCWLFMALGGWRDHYTVVLEPCTNYPKDMQTAIGMGTCMIMKPFEKRTFTVSISLRKSNDK
ncbi:MAG: hypothetical protein WBW71_01125 [Bacteroidota bacterium]